MFVRGKKPQYVFLALVLTLVFFLGCDAEKEQTLLRGDNEGVTPIETESSSEDASADEDLEIENKTVDEEPEEEVKDEEDDEDLEVDKELENAPGGFQVKSFEVLSSSIDSCMGNPDYKLITADMSALSDEPLPDGGKRFLLGGVAGQNILELEKANLGGNLPPRTTINSDALTDQYLRAIGVVADVVAHNCDLQDPKCNCTIRANAEAMMKRCFPALNPTTPDFQSAVDGLHNACSTGGAEGQRKAIAAVIGSYAFLQGR